MARRGFAGVPPNSDPQDSATQILLDPYLLTRTQKNPNQITESDGSQTLVNYFTLDT